MAILYGIKQAVITELGADGNAAAEGTVIKFKTAEQAELEPVMSEGDEEILRNAEQILAVVRTDDLLYGYDITLKDNLFDPAIAGLVAGYQVTTGEDRAVEKIATPMMNDGCIAKEFKLELYVANYEGDAIVNYAKVTFNKCKGKFPSMTLGNEFFAPEFEIKARENSKAKLPIKEITFVEELPAD